MSFSFFFVESLGVFLPASLVGEAFVGSTVVAVGDDAWATRDACLCSSFSAAFTLCLAPETKISKENR